MNLNTSKPLEQQLVPTNEAAVMLYFGVLLSNNHIPFLYHGPESSKTLIIQTMMRDYLDSSFDCKQIPIGNTLTSKQLLNSLKNSMHKRSGAYGPLTNQHLIMFFDNIKIGRASCRERVSDPV